LFLKLVALELFTGTAIHRLPPIAQIKYEHKQTTLEEKTIQLLATLLDCSESVQKA
jgi:hypothetical protein